MAMILATASSRVSVVLVGPLSLVGDFVIGAVDASHDVNISEVAPNEVQHFDGAFTTSEVKFDRASDSEAILNRESAPFVHEGAVGEGASDESVAVQGNDLVGKNGIFVSHGPSPVAVPLATVAEAGGVASAPGGGQTA